jgi:hypothetical protein
MVTLSTSPIPFARKAPRRRKADTAVLVSNIAKPSTCLAVKTKYLKPQRIMRLAH